VPTAASPPSRWPRRLRTIGATWLAGLLLLLPLALTAAVIGWLASLLNQWAGPGSLIGRFFALLGYPLARDSGFAYLTGTAVLLLVIYLLGVIAQAGWHASLQQLAERALRRIPLIGPLYGVAERVVGMLEQKGDNELAAMRPVWCLFGGNGVAVLALAPGAEPVQIDGRSYVAVLIPTAPVPIGGALLYVPLDWVRPAEIGVDKLTAVYVSMGITPPTARPS
jgi:uncharacterized membrane protein